MATARRWNDSLALIILLLLLGRLLLLLLLLSIAHVSERAIDAAFRNSVSHVCTRDHRRAKRATAEGAHDESPVRRLVLSGVGFRSICQPLIRCQTVYGSLVSCCMTGEILFTTLSIAALQSIGLRFIGQFVSSGVMHTSASRICSQSDLPFRATRLRRICEAHKRDEAIDEAAAILWCMFA